MSSSIETRSARYPLDVSVSLVCPMVLSTQENTRTPALRVLSVVVSVPSTREATTKSASSLTSGSSMVGISLGSFCPSASSVTQYCAPSSMQSA